MAIITKEMLEGNKVKGSYIEGVILLQNYTVCLTKNGKYYYNGTLTSGVDIPFKVWDNSGAYPQLRNNDLSGKVVEIHATWDEYNGVFSLILNSVKEVEGVSEANFLPTKYDVDAYFSSLINMIKNIVSDKAFALADSTLFSNSDIVDAFKIEFAAKSHHDNCKGGLLAHTYKVCYLTSIVISTYFGGTLSQDEKDMLILGALFHDIGKVKEMHFGQYTDISVVTHRYLGVEMLDKQAIIELYGEDWYYYLVSIMLQHHGEYGDPCKSFVAYIVNQVDMLDANMTLLEQKLEDSSARELGRVSMNGSYLEVLKGGETDA